jgi:tRNA-binding protein
MTGQPGDLSFADFLKVDVRVGTILRAEPYPEARRPAVKLWVDFGPDLGVKKTSAQITQIGKFMSEILVLGFPDAEGEVVMIAPDRPVPNGGRLY